MVTRIVSTHIRKYLLLIKQLDQPQSSYLNAYGICVGHDELSLLIFIQSAMPLKLWPWRTLLCNQFIVIIISVSVMFCNRMTWIWLRRRKVHCDLCLCSGRRQCCWTFFSQQTPAKYSVDVIFSLHSAWRVGQIGQVICVSTSNCR